MKFKTNLHVIHDTAKQAGSVNTHASIILPAIPHLTAESLRVDPTPMIEVDMTCVVLTGIPIALAPRMTTVAEVSAANP